MISQLNTRADLDALRGAPSYDAAMAALHGSLTTKVNVAVYPDGYGQPDYDGPAIDPVWQEQENLESITKLGFTKDEFAAAYALTQAVGE